MTDSYSIRRFCYVSDTSTKKYLYFN